MPITIDIFLLDPFLWALIKTQQEGGGTRRRGMGMGLLRKAQPHEKNCTVARVVLLKADVFSLIHWTSKGTSKERRKKVKTA